MKMSKTSWLSSLTRHILEPTSSAALVEDRAGLSPGRPAAPGLLLPPPHSTESFVHLRQTGRTALAILLVAGLALGVLLLRTVIAGAVVASGSLVVASGPKSVQPPTAGVISELLVAEGGSVKSGQLLVRMDDKLAHAQLHSVVLNLAQQQARLARLLAEQDGLPKVSFDSVEQSPELSAEEYQTIFSRERRQFEIGEQERDGQKKKLQEQILQAEQAIEGERAQLDASKSDTALVEDQSRKMRKLFEQKLATSKQVNDLERVLAQSRGTEGTLKSQMAANRGKISELQLAIVQVDKTLRSVLTDQIADAQTAIAQLVEQRSIAQTLLDQTQITAPEAGRVLDLQIHTVGGVVQPGQTLMTIVPDKDVLVGSIRIKPADVDQIYPGQEVNIQFSAFDRGTTPTAQGTLKSISPDLVRDPATGAAYYEARVEVNQPAFEHATGVKLVAGMPLEAFVKTNDRTILTYLTKPLSDQINHAFR